MVLFCHAEVVQHHLLNTGSFDFPHLFEMPLLSHNKALCIGVYVDFLFSSIDLSVYSSEDQLFDLEGDQSVLPQKIPFWYEDYSKLKASNSLSLPLFSLKAGHKFSFVKVCVSLQ